MYQRLYEKNIKEECTSLAKGALQCFSCRLELSQLRRSFQQHSHHHIINIIKKKNVELISRLQIPKFLHSHPRVSYQFMPQSIYTRVLKLIMLINLLKIMIKSIKYARKVEYPFRSIKYEQIPRKSKTVHDFMLKHGIFC